MISAPVFWGVACGAIYFLIMWWIRSHRLDQQRESTRLLYALSEQIVAAHTPSGIEQRLQETMPRLLKASSVEMELGSSASQSASLVLPLISHDQALGALKIHRSSGAFTDEERAVAQHIANIVASALQLQKCQVPREKAPVAQTSASANGSLTIMLIDPEPDSQRDVLQMLNARGHRVLPASPEEAEELARRMRFDAVLRVGDDIRESLGNQIWLTRPVSDEKLDQVSSRIRC